MSAAPTPCALLALHEAHTLLMAAVLSSPRPPGPLLEAAVVVGESLDVLEDREAIEKAAEVLRDLWPPHRTRAMLRRAVQVGDLTAAEIAAWVAAQGGSGLEAESALAALLDVVQAGEIALAEAEAALEDERERAVGGEG